MFMQFMLCFSLVVSSLTFENKIVFHCTVVLIKHVKYYSIQQKSFVFAVFNINVYSRTVQYNVVQRYLVLLFVHSVFVNVFAVL